MPNEIVTQDGEIIEESDLATGSLAIGLARAEIDQQVATAKRYPRSIAKAQRAIFELVTIDEESAKECNYALPRGGKPITGPSIRLAEIIASEYGNNRTGARVVHVDRAEKYVEAEGVYIDLESNAATTARVRRRIVDKNGRIYNDDMIIVTGNAACSIAKRNAILAAVPKAVWRKAYDAALATIKGDIKTLAERRATMLKAFAAFGVKPEQIFAALDIGGIDDVGLDEIALLTGMHGALKSGEETVESMFGGSAKPEGGAEKKSLKGKLQDVADGKPKDDGKKPEKATAKADEKAETEKPADKPARGSTRDEAEANHIEDHDGNTVKDNAGPADDDDDFPGDRPSADEIEAAKDRGGEAYHRGQSRKAAPKEYAEKPALLRAWQEAYDEAKAEEEGGEA